MSALGNSMAFLRKEKCFRSTPDTTGFWRHMHANVASDTQLAGIAAKKYLGTKWVASALTMQSKPSK